MVGLRGYFKLAESLRQGHHLKGGATRQRPLRRPLAFAVGRKLPWLVQACGVRSSVANAKLLDKGRLYLYFNALNLHSLGFFPPTHFG